MVLSKGFGLRSLFIVSVDFVRKGVAFGDMSPTTSGVEVQLLKNQAHSKVSNKDEHSMKTVVTKVVGADDLLQAHSV